MSHFQRNHIINDITIIDITVLFHLRLIVQGSSQRWLIVTHHFGMFILLVADCSILGYIKWLGFMVKVGRPCDIRTARAQRRGAIHQKGRHPPPAHFSSEKI
jgi:hypothetical protein